MIGYALFQGHYGAGNVSLAGSPLQLSSQVNTGCVTFPNPSSIVFLPDNDTAVLYPQNEGNPNQEQVTIGASTESCSVNSAGAYLCGLGKGLSGYWNTTTPITEQQATIGSPFFRPLPEGEYTLAVEDMWNQTIYAHFQVVPLTRLECPAESSNSGFGTIRVGTNSPAIVCVQFYYEAFSPLTLNLTDPLIEAPLAVPNGSLENTPWVNWGSNFTVTASQSQLPLGGHAIVNEGSTVAFAITAKPGTSGTFFLGFLPSALLLDPSEPQN